jgi:hypothetical protein
MPFNTAAFMSELPPKMLVLPSRGPSVMALK